MTQILFRNAYPPFDIVSNQPLEAELWRLIQEDNHANEANYCVDNGRPLTSVSELYRLAVENLTKEQK